MKGSGGRSLRQGLAILVLLAAVPPIGLFGWIASDNQQRASREARERVLRLARLAIGEHERIVEGTRQLLMAFSYLPEIHRGGEADCSALMARLKDNFNWYSNVGAIHPDGSTFCSGFPMTTPVNSSHRSWFQYAVQQRRFAIGDYQVSQVTKRPTVNLALPIVGQGGAVEAVIFAALELGWLNHLLAQTQVPPGCTVTVVDRHGVVLARYPDPETWLGKSAADVPVIREMLAQTEGTTQAQGLDGVSRLYGFTHLSGPSHGGDMYLSVGMPAEVAFAGFRQGLYRSLVGLGVVLVLVALIAWVGGQFLVVRQAKTLAGAARRLAAGDSKTRTGPPYGRGEFGEIAKALDEVGSLIDKRQGGG